MKVAPPGSRCIGSLPAGTKVLGIRTFAPDLVVIATSDGVYVCQGNGKLEKLRPLEPSSEDIRMHL